MIDENAEVLFDLSKRVSHNPFAEERLRLLHNGGRQRFRQDNHLKFESRFSVSTAGSLAARRPSAINQIRLRRTPTPHRRSRAAAVAQLASYASGDGRPAARLKRLKTRAWLADMQSGGQSYKSQRRSSDFNSVRIPAEGVGFEPTNELPRCQFSRPVP
jgi:hypothetical protein